MILTIQIDRDDDDVLLLEAEAHPIPGTPYSRMEWQCRDREQGMDAHGEIKFLTKARTLDVVRQLLHEVHARKL